VRRIPRKRQAEDDVTPTSVARQRRDDSAPVSTSSSSPPSSTSAWAGFTTRTPISTPQRSLATSQLGVNSQVSSPTTPTDTKALVTALDTLSSWVTPTSAPQVQHPSFRPTDRLYHSYQSNFDTDMAGWRHQAARPILQFWVPGKPLIDRCCKFYR
jgi:hypothetical protein